jgi:putative membrane protein
VKPDPLGRGGVSKPAARWWLAGLRNGSLLLVLLVASVLLLHGAEISAMPVMLAALPLAICVSLAAHLPQIAFTALAWQVLVPTHQRLPLTVMLALRWYREAADALLPVGGLIGQAAITRLMVRRGVTADVATATAGIGLLLEAFSQLIFTLMGLALLLALQTAAGHVEFLLGLGFALLSAISLFAVLHPRSLVALRSALVWLQRRWPRISLSWLDETRLAVQRVHAERKALFLATLLHLAAWLMGALEIMALFHLLGHPIGIAEAIVIESLAQVLRNVGFLLPGAVGVQEGALIAAAALFGIPPATALSAALVRRTREVALVGLPGLLAWRRAETLPPSSRDIERPVT